MLAVAASIPFVRLTEIRTLTLRTVSALSKPSILAPDESNPMSFQTFSLNRQCLRTTEY